MKFAIVIVLLAISLPSNSQTSKSPASDDVCKRFKLFRQHNVDAWSFDSSGHGTFFYVAGLAVDADGAFRAYHPTSHLGLDALVNAGHPGHWWALATDTGKTSGHPVVQGRGDPAPG